MVTLLSFVELGLYGLSLLWVVVSVGTVVWSLAQVRMLRDLLGVGAMGLLAVLDGLPLLGGWWLLGWARTRWG